MTTINNKITKKTNKTARAAIGIISLLIVILAAFGLYFLQSGVNATRNKTGVFNGERAYQDVQYQVSLGSRVPGTPGHAKIVAWMQQQLKAAGWNSEIQASTMMGHPVENVVAWKGNKPQNLDGWLIFGAHYDTRMWANQDPDPAKRKDYVPGANDGASGVALLLEMARVLPEVNSQKVQLVFFDAEDNGEITGWDWLLGSIAYVKQIQGKPQAAIIVDMIGDADLNIYYEGNSNQQIMQSIWNTAKSLGYQQFIPKVKYYMEDDHTPFLQAGIPAVDIIDFDYPYWHTTQDTVDKVSAISLEAVGNTLVTWMKTERK